jgi:conjugal transfer pilus assembly protein TraB
MESIKNWWKTRTPEQQRKYKIGGALLSLLIVVGIGGQLGRKNLAANAMKQAEKTDQTIFQAKPQNLRSQDQEAQIQQLHGQIDKLTNLLQMQGHLSKTQLDQALSNAERYNRDHGGQLVATPNPQQEQEIAALSSQVQSLQQQLQQAPVTQTPASAAPSPSGAMTLYEMNGSGQAPTAGGTDDAQAPTDSGVPEAPKAPTNLMSLGSPKEKKVVKIDAKDSVFLPAGTILTGVLLNGLQAATGPSAQSNPQIVELRVKKSAIMPNKFRANLKDCEVIASGFGDLSARRVYLRTNELSCVSRDGSVISAPMHGFIVGADGLTGVPGTVIEHQSELLDKGLLAGLLSGLGTAATPQSVSPLNINPGSTAQFQMPSASYVGGSALMGGVSNASGLIAKFYLHEAESLLPTIQINPGISADIILESGAKIKTDGMSATELAQAQWEASGNSRQSSNGGEQDPAQKGTSSTQTATK